MDVIRIPHPGTHHPAPHLRPRVDVRHHCNHHIRCLPIPSSSLLQMLRHCGIGQSVTGSCIKVHCNVKQSLKSAFKCWVDRGED